MYYTLLKHSIVLVAAGAAGLYDETKRDRPRLGADRYHEAGLAPAAPGGGGSHKRNTAG